MITTLLLNGKRITQKEAKKVFGDVMVDNFIDFAKEKYCEKPWEIQFCNTAYGKLEAKFK